MISVADARRMVLECCQALAVERRPLAESLGSVVAEEVICGADSPPHDKSQVDGYAVRAADVAGPGTVLRVLEQVTAGQVPTLPLAEQTATRIMTGAPIPDGADAVVMVEQTEVVDEATPLVRLTGDSVRPGQNIMRRGQSMMAGNLILRPGHAIRAIEVGLLAELGITHVLVFAKPQVAVMATGNELVDAEEKPGRGQIRNSNGPMLHGLVREAGGVPVDLGVGRDEVSELSRLVRAGLDGDILLLSGGVSAGVLDLVPQVLKDLGVREVFHKVHLKPGKPLWFGVFPGEHGRNKLVFGLPGNPVSSLVGFHLFVRPALARVAGRSSEGLSCLTAAMARDHMYRSDRPTYHPGRARSEGGSLIVEPLGWHGSADLRTLVDANVLIYFPPGAATLRAGEQVMVYLL